MASAINPRVRKAFTVIGHSPDVVELRTGVWNPRSFTLTDETEGGKLFNIVSGLDGSLSRRDLAKREGVSRADVEAVVDHLYGLGVIEETPTGALDAYVEQVATIGAAAEAPRFADRLLLLGDPRITEQIEAQSGGALRIPVSRPGAADPLWKRFTELEPAALHDGLDVAALAEEFAPWRDSFAVLAESTIRPLRFRAFNRLAQELNITWIHGALDGPFVFVGPTVVPHRSACWECFETRVTMNLREASSYLTYKNALAKGDVLAGEAPVLPALTGLLASHLGLETVNYLHSGSTFSIDKVLGVYLPTMEIAYNEVLRMPGCRGCAPVPERDDTSLVFDPRTWLDD
ncbi:MULTISPECIES: TOMM precursor leader peptide-binding protein [Streptomyces]|nr:MULTISPECIES: TOMM precursor leader peptide-binding protein [Streptomyces]MCH0555575.1 TOMM precursor leader peptide-binding protein [Streptomyces sp. MUM 16J]